MTLSTHCYKLPLFSIVDRKRKVRSINNMLYVMNNLTSLVSSFSFADLTFIVIKLEHFFSQSAPSFPMIELLCLT